MKVYYYASATPMNYLHVFSGDRDEKGYVAVNESFIKFGKYNAYFTKHNERVFIGHKPQNIIELSDISYSLVNMLFDGDFNLGDNDFHEINL